MKFLYRILRWLSLGAIGVSTILIFLNIGFVWLWDINSVNSIGEAKEFLSKHGSIEHELIINECSKLIQDGEERTLMHEDIPEVLKSLSPQYVRASEYSCEVNLYKQPGKGIGYFVKKSPSGSFILSWFNHFESWESHDFEVK